MAKLPFFFENKKISRFLYIIRYQCFLTIPNTNYCTFKIKYISLQLLFLKSKKKHYLCGFIL